MSLPEPAQSPAPPPAIAREVEDALARSDRVRHAAMLRAVTTLFTDAAARLREPEVALFDTVMLPLARAVDARPRATLAERIADLPNAPRAVVRDLAFDPEVSVAGPVLARSPRLAEGDLVRVASARGPAHLLAITRRRSLSERVSDILVARGDEAVVHAVAGHVGASLSGGGLAALTERAETDAGLRAALAVRATLEEARDAELATHVEAATAAVAARVSGRSGLGLDEGDVAAWLRDGRLAEGLVGLARAAGVPSAAALRAQRAAQYDPLLFLVRSARFGWPTCRLLLEEGAGPAVPTALRRAAPDADTLDSARRAFEALSVATAQRVLRFTAQREQAAGTTDPDTGGDPDAGPAPAAA